MAKKLSGRNVEKSPRSGKALTFSERFLQIREHFALSQGDLAKMTGGSPSTIGLIERGKTVAPNADILIALARKLSINSDWLLFGEGEMLKPAHAETKSVQHSGKPKTLIKPDVVSVGAHLPEGTIVTLPNGRPMLNYSDNLAGQAQPTEPLGFDLIQEVARHGQDIQALRQAVELLAAQQAASSHQ